MSRADNDNDVLKLGEMRAGDLLHYDYRPDQGTSSSSSNNTTTAAKLSDTFRVVQWNIERGLKLDAIIADLKALNADFIALQELDVNCRRSNYINVPKELAKALQAELYFVCEFEELDAPCRSAHNAVGPQSQPSQESVEGNHKKNTNRHFHGNAILSRRATLREATVVPHTAPVYWDEEGDRFNEPRRGYRSALRVRVDPSERTSPKMPPLYIYCCHFEVFCGALARVRQLADCMADMQRILRLSSVVASGSTSTHQPAFLLAGDLNTMAHGIVRFSRRYGNDRLRLLSVGESEACWLQRKVLSRGMQSLERGCCPFSYGYPAYLASRVHQWLWNNKWVWRFVYGFSATELERMSNVKLCLYDPADKAKSITLDNPDYRGFVCGKLDWLLLSNLQPQPFRTQRGGAQPVDHAALERSGSVSASSYTAKYLRSIQEGGQSDEARTAGIRPDEVASKYVPEDGYLLFNEKYTASDHRGLVMTVRQNNGKAKDVYPEYGAPYTLSWAALSFFTLTRVAPVAAIAFLVYRSLHNTSCMTPKAL
jgi:endonuclease/exonuclease/phosphatase family metal-dependent hydrolase